MDDISVNLLPEKKGTVFKHNEYMVESKVRREVGRREEGGERREERGGGRREESRREERGGGGEKGGTELAWQA